MVGAGEAEAGQLGPLVCGEAVLVHAGGGHSRHAGQGQYYSYTRHAGQGEVRTGYSGYSGLCADL